jgi:hypothetical protein
MSALQTVLAEPRQQGQVESLTNLQLFPALFRVAQQAPVSGTSSVRIGLRALSLDVMIMTQSAPHAAKVVQSIDRRSKRREIFESAARQYILHI